LNADARRVRAAAGAGEDAIIVGIVVRTGEGRFHCLRAASHVSFGRMAFHSDPVFSTGSASSTVPVFAENTGFPAIFTCITCVHGKK